MEAMQESCKNAREASRVLKSLDCDYRNDILREMKMCIEENKDIILNDINKADVDTIQKRIEDNKVCGEDKDSLYQLKKRLELTTSKLDSCIKGIDHLISLEDPLGKCDMANDIWMGSTKDSYITHSRSNHHAPQQLPSDDNPSTDLDFCSFGPLDLYRVTIPIGVLCVIYESRPEVGIQVAALAVKTGNALLLKGGKEALLTNRCIYNLCIMQALSKFVQKYTQSQKEDLRVEKLLNMILLLDTREDIQLLLKMNRYIDLVIARGSNSLVKYIQSNTSIAVLGHADGVCSVYVDDNDDGKADSLSDYIDVILDSKFNYPNACNSCELLLINQKVCEVILNKLNERIIKQKRSIKYVADDTCYKHIASCINQNDYGHISVERSADMSDFGKEYLTTTLAVMSVAGIYEAIDHINMYGSHHTDCILTQSPQNADLFMRNVDSASKMHNCSTRFADGYRYGFGGEVGISTSRIHCRGPVGLDGLVTYEYRLYGNRHTVEKYEKFRKRVVNYYCITPYMLTGYDSVQAIRNKYCVSNFLCDGN